MSEFIYGKNPVREALNANKKIYKLYLTKNNQELIDLAKRKKVNYQIVTQEFLQKLVSGVHQGAVAEVDSYRYYSLEEILDTNKKYPLIVILDGLEDPHNLGAILRICDAAGVDGIIIPKHRSVGLNHTVAKVSTGAIEYVKVAVVTNITQTIKKLKDKGYWVVGSDAGEMSVDYSAVDYKIPIALIIGSEGKGISRLVLENCDYVVRIPMYGHVNSLNASVSCGILVYQILEKRKE
ncbi:MAG TPA: 23S rRNA (guanosine(2251)-2'-O)-methyltransferase RlmB [Acholeplasmataceae bacterium]|nr:23S rRNA (guanosine(2251)-2'-O)-methyltransferase RlmB [Acholeplasmataceae bacterium]